MKKIILSIALIFTLSVAASAQKDGFFGWNDLDDSNERYHGADFELSLPSSHGMDTDNDAPLGGGLLILAALGGSYLLIKKK